MEKAPEFLEVSEPLESQYNIGGNFSINCEVDGQPKPEIHWYRNGELLENANLIINNENPTLNNDNFTEITHQTFLSSDKKQIRILNATIENFGEYTCMAFNKIGKIYRDFHTKFIPYWGEWSKWSDCSKSCGLGARKRYRVCIQMHSHQGKVYCDGSDEEAENCYTPCILDWAPCSRTCGPGQTYRVIGDNVEVASCYRGPCGNNNLNKAKFLPLHTWESSRKSQSRN